MNYEATSNRVILINPPVHDFAAFDFWAKPMGLLVIAEELKKHGIEPALIDALDPYHPALEGLPRPARKAHGKGKFYAEEIPKPAALADVPRKYKRYGLPPDRLRRALETAPGARAVMVTCAMTYWYPGVVEVISIIRDISLSMPIILGGGYATLCSDHARRHSGADIVHTGSIEGCRSLEDIPGFDVSREALFTPALDLYQRLEYAPILTSRGCPFGCEYCASALLFGGYEAREPGEVVDEINRAYSAGIRDFAFYDDALALSPARRLVPILEEILQRGIEARFHTPNGMHVQDIDDDLAALMRRAGFVTIRLGVETTATGAARRDKKLDPDSLPRVAEAFLKAGYKPGEAGAYLLAGLPGQQPEEVERDINAVRQMGLRPYLSEYSPIPGTTLFREAVDISRYDIEEEPLTHNNSILPCASETFTLDDLQRLKQMTWPKK